ncbi:conserved hypothetical protein [Methanococcus vannielii SB]|uniref:NurA domain-containing protein n=1 Tax=Methanococcus vannielii (strain ATCC 35089 / DSM 1224 / JCM 13029 / OCM 148 / SB) TaxID=406327 RepID=A6UPK9_METVS|nr:DNA double-strand break repair nuclease NurA [Methanococcus vannielii]ABR54431.1 conserved hypothetical protein [Methanococcus vannielii SB]
MDFSTLIQKKEKVVSKIQNINFNHDHSKYWIESLFIHKSDMKFSGGDGSFNKIDYINYCLYLTGAVSYCQSVGGTIEKSVSAFDGDIILPYKYVQNRLSRYMLNTELKVALSNLIKSEIDYYLYDGSLYSFLVQTNNHMTVNGKKLEETIFDYYKEYSRIIRSKIFEEITSGCISSAVDISFENSLNEEQKIALEQLEYLILLSEITKYQKKMVGIAKTSKMNIYFENALIPDLALFSRCKKSGYSIPVDLISEKVNKNFYKNVDYFKKFGIDLKNLYYQFVKLEDNSGILCATSFEKLDETFYSNLKEISVSGYPYILKKSHENVKIENSDVLKFARLLGIYEESDRDSNLKF